MICNNMMHSGHKNPTSRPILYHTMNMKDFALPTVCLPPTNCSLHRRSKSITLSDREKFKAVSHIWLFTKYEPLRATVYGQCPPFAAGLWFCSRNYGCAMAYGSKIGGARTQSALGRYDTYSTYNIDEIYELDYCTENNLHRNWPVRLEL